MFSILFLLFFCCVTHAQESTIQTMATTAKHESVIDKIQIPIVQEEIAQPVIESTTNISTVTTETVTTETVTDDEDIDFDNLTDQMEESGIDFTIDEPSSLQLLVRKIGVHFLPLLPYYLAARKWTNRKISWMDKKQNQCATFLYSLLAYCTITTNE